MKYDICIIGGAGHVGLPLGVAFANANKKTILLDINKQALDIILSGTFPFKEEGGDNALKKALKKGTLFATSDESVIGESKFLIMTIGTPIDEYLNPDFTGLMKILKLYSNYYRDGQILILRSTVYPGTSGNVQKFFNNKKKKVQVVFCPERIVEGCALRELKELPQIVAGFDVEAVKIVSDLFKTLTKKIVLVSDPMEAELAKLFSNAWRYIKFAVANQFFMIASKEGLDYYKIHNAMTKDYARNADLPRPGFAAGPCLFKDTMQLVAFNNNNFFLGHSAMLINEGLPSYIIQKTKRSFQNKNNNQDLKSMTIGILGMAFKAESDDPRDSLSYKLRKIAETEVNTVICHDVYIKDPSFVSVDDLISKSDIIILGTPHKEYLKINPKTYPQKIFIDIWGVWDADISKTKNI
jgi:UDP-N-acetyl-D-mannosaminuronic acid dehydrogenase